MSKSKKVTYKELMERNDFLLSRLMQVEKAVNYTHTLIIAYIDSNSHQEKLKEFLEKENENGQSDKSNTNGDRENQPGDIVTDAKSAKTGGKSKARTNKTKAQKYC